MGNSDYGPGAGPPPRVPTEDELARVLGEHSMGALAAVRRSGHPHLSTVAYVWDVEHRVARISTTADRAKVGMLRRNFSTFVPLRSDRWFLWHGRRPSGPP